MSTYPVANEFVRGLLRQRDAGIRSASTSTSPHNESSAASASSFVSHVSNDGSDKIQNSFLAEFRRSNRGNIKWQNSASVASRYCQRSPLNRMEVGLNLQELPLPANHVASDENTSTASSSRASSLSTLSSGTARNGKITKNKTLTVRDMNSCAFARSGEVATISSTRTAKLEIDDLERKLQKIREAFAQLETETAQLNKEACDLKEVSRGLRNGCRVMSQKRGNQEDKTKQDQSPKHLLRGSGTHLRYGLSEGNQQEREQPTATTRHQSHQDYSKLSRNLDSFNHHENQPTFPASCSSSDSPREERGLQVNNDSWHSHQSTASPVTSLVASNEESHLSLYNHTPYAKRPPLPTSSSGSSSRRRSPNRSPVR